MNRLGEEGTNKLIFAFDNYKGELNCPREAALFNVYFARM